MTDEAVLEGLSESDKVAELLQRVKDLETLSAGLTEQLRKARPYPSPAAPLPEDMDAETMASELEKARSGAFTTWFLFMSSDPFCHGNATVGAFAKLLTAMVDAEFYRMAYEDEHEKAEQALLVLRKQQEVRSSSKFPLCSAATLSCRKWHDGVVICFHFLQDFDRERNFFFIASKSSNESSTSDSPSMYALLIFFEIILILYFSSSRLEMTRSTLQFERQRSEKDRERMVAEIEVLRRRLSQVELEARRFEELFLLAQSNFSDSPVVQRRDPALKYGNDVFATAKAKLDDALSSLLSNVPNRGQILAAVTEFCNAVEHELADEQRSLLISSTILLNECASADALLEALAHYQKQTSPATAHRPMPTTRMLTT